MKSRFSFVLVTCCALLIAAAFAFTASGNQQDNEKEGRPQWEHLALPHGADLAGDLSRQINRLGNEGWQLVCVTAIAKEGTTEKTVYYFKRPK